jgi:hypothetical protein
LPQNAHDASRNFRQDHSWWEWMPTAKRGFQLAELVARPPSRQGAESILILDAAMQVLTNERHET